MDSKALPFVCIALAACLALGACGRPRPSGPGPTVVFDEAYAEARPDLVEALGGSDPSGKRGVTVVPMDGGPGRLAEIAKKAAAKDSTTAQRIIASPFLATALAAGDEELARQGGTPGGPRDSGLKALGGASLVVPDYEGPDKPYLIPVTSDLKPAFAAAGRAAGKGIAVLVAKGEASATAAILYRPRNVEAEAQAQAFIVAYTDAAGKPPLVERLAAQNPDAKADEGAMDRILGQDLRFVLLAMGPGLHGALSHLSRPGLELGVALDIPPQDFPVELAPGFCIFPDTGAFTGLLREAVDKGPPPSGKRIQIPGQLALNPQTGIQRAAFFERFLRAEGARQPKMR